MPPCRVSRGMCQHTHTHHVHTPCTCASAWGLHVNMGTPQATHAWTWGFSRALCHNAAASSCHVFGGLQPRATSRATLASFSCVICHIHILSEICHVTFGNFAHWCRRRDWLVSVIASQLEQLQGRRKAMLKVARPTCRYTAARSVGTRTRQDTNSYAADNPPDLRIATPATFVRAWLVACSLSLTHHQMYARMRRCVQQDVWFYF